MARRSSVQRISATRTDVIQAVDAMPADLVAVYERLRGLVRDGTNNVIDYYMKVGEEVMEVQKHLDVYGESALILLTRALVFKDESSLRRAAQIRGILTDSDIEKIKKRNETQMRSGGSPVTWSHLQTLTYNVTTRKGIFEYLEKVWEDDLSIRDLRALLGGESERAEPRVPALPGGISRSTDNIAARSSALVAIFDRYSEFFADEDAVRNASSDADFRARASVAAANLKRLAEHALAQANNLSRIAEAVPAVEQPAQLALPAPAAPPVADNLQTSPIPGRTRRVV